MANTQQGYKCPQCSTALKVTAPGKAYFYGSPIRQCPKCAYSYLDRNYHEIEIDGIREADLSVKQSLKLTLFCLVGLVVCIAGWYFLNKASGPLVKLPTAFIIGALLFGIGFFVLLADMLKILTGTKKKQLENERQASAKRLSDRDYALKLQNLGYQIPEKYL